MQAYSLDLRKRIVQGRQQGASAQELAERYQVCKRTVERYWNRYQQEGHVTCRQRGGYRKSRLLGHEKTVRQWIKQEPDLTLPQLSDRCREALDVELSPSHLCRCLAKLGLSFKKNDTRRRARASRRAGRSGKLA